MAGNPAWRWQSLPHTMAGSMLRRAWGRNVDGSNSPVSGIPGFRNKGKRKPVTWENDPRETGLFFLNGGGAGNRTPVRQGPTTSFSVRSLRFYVGSGLPETGCPHPSPLGLDLAFESITRGAVAIGDVHWESWRRKPPGTWTLFKRPVRNFRWQLLFAPCFTSSGNSARCP